MSFDRCARERNRLEIVFGGENKRTVLSDVLCSFVCVFRLRDVRGLPRGDRRHCAEEQAETSLTP